MAPSDRRNLPATAEEISVAAAAIEYRHRLRQPVARPSPYAAYSHLGKSRPLMRLWIAARGICHLCDRPVALQHATRDHIVPKSRGGTAVALAHSFCNNAKGNLTLGDPTQDAYLRVARAICNHEKLTWFEPVPEEYIHESRRLASRGLRLPKPWGRVSR